MVNERIRMVIKDLLPLAVLKKYFCPNRRFDFSHNYSDWNEARALSAGYDSDIILEKTREAMLKVKNGEYAFARDSVLFDKIQYPVPILTGLLKAAAANNGELNVLDFGGSLGTSYYQYRNFLKQMKKLAWNIVEQPKFVACGKRFFENTELKFYYSVEDCCREEKPHTALLSGVIQYIEKPYSLLEDIMKRNFCYLLLDRTAFLKKGLDRLTIEKVPARIYNCSYPIWFFNYDNFVARLSSRYELITAFDSIDKASGPYFFKGLILKLK
jgi:putative methyltransferase (TIGR04325 family)